MQDPISDLLTQIRNAGEVNKQNIIITSSKIKITILYILLSRGYINNFKIFIKEINKPMIIIFLKYYKNKHVINKIKRVSRPGLRVYKGIKNLPNSLNGMGLYIISTSKGIISDNKARNIHIGGEVLCLIE